MLGRYYRLEPTPSRAEPVGSNREPRNKPSEAMSFCHIELWKGWRIDHGEGFIDEGARRFDTDITGDRARQIWGLELARRATMMSGAESGGCSVVSSQ